jgi:adenylate cyclase
VLWRAQQIGLIDTHERGTRWVPLFAQLPSLRYEHMALRLALLHWGLRVDAVRMEPDRIGLVKTDGEQVAAVPLVDRQLMEINWFSRWESEKDAHLAFSRVMAHAQALTSDDADERRVGQKYFEQFKDAIVLIGPVDPLLQDLAPTPLDDVAVPRVGVYGNALKTILSGQYLVRIPQWAYFGIVFGLTFLATGLAIAGGARGLLAKLVAVVAIGGYGFICFHLFAQSHIVLPMTAPLGAALSTSFAGVIWQLIVEEKQKGRIKNMFGTYLSPELVSRMVESAEDPKLGGHEEVITAYFSDIQSFSSFSEMLPPDRLVELMNEYLTACTDLVQEEGGTLDKYIGDAVVAIYGAPIALPDHAFRACVATQRVQLRIAELRDKWKGESGQWPEVVHNLRARIGLNTGPAIIGNMGSRSRFSYTMMGDNVNLAARMESGAKSWGAYTMCTEATKAACEQHGGDRVVFRPLGRIVVMGRSQPVPVYEITGLREHLTTQTFDCLGLFAQGLEKYYARDWDGAIKAFQQSARTEPLVPGRAAGVKSNPSLVYLDICQHFKQEPPPESWDGVYVMKEK